MAIVAGCFDRSRSVQHGEARHRRNGPFPPVLLFPRGNPFNKDVGLCWFLILTVSMTDSQPTNKRINWQTRSLIQRQNDYLTCWLTGCSLGIGDRRILRLLRRILRLNFDGLEIHISYSDEEPLCSRKLYLAKMVSFFPRRYTQNALNK